MRRHATTRLDSALSPRDEQGHDCVSRDDRRGDRPPLPAVGMKVSVTGRYDFARMFSTGMVRVLTTG